MKLTKFQLKVQELLKDNKSVLLVAPTGLGKTLAVTADLQERPRKTVYAVPLRALGVGIRDAISKLGREREPLKPVIHHGDLQESVLFGEEVVVTTYDQVVCGAPGLPLSLPLKAGHAVAAALLMSRLILDEVHLAWGISDNALSILLAIIDFRNKLGLQTIVQTATLPDSVAKMLSKAIGLEVVIVVEDGLKIIEAGVERTEKENDEGLERRETNRYVVVSSLDVGTKGEQREIDYGPLDEKLRATSGKRIYFCNTVKRLQQTYDRLIKLKVNPDCVTVLHNRMPRSWRHKAETEVAKRFGEKSQDGNWVLLTNQVAEAGLDISAPLVISDSAPVDTLVQRAGRCGRWFRDGKTTGEFWVLKGKNDSIRNELANPYKARGGIDFVQPAMNELPNGNLTWAAEREWVNKTWGGESKKALAAVQKALDESAFALNLFDRAAQEHRPGEIASAFREILSVEVAVEEAGSKRDLQKLIDERQYPETSSVSLKVAYKLLRETGSNPQKIGYEKGALQVTKADYIQPGDVLVVSSNVAVLDPKKGLCFDGLDAKGVVRQSEWRPNKKADELIGRESRRQGLFEHTHDVMKGTYERLTSAGSYRDALTKILRSLERQTDANTNTLANIIAQIATVAAGFHDLGKADMKWQAKAREIDPEFPDGLIGRTANIKRQIGRPHTPPSFKATLMASDLLIGRVDSAEHLIRAIALAGARHHSSLTNPASVDYVFEPDSRAREFVTQVLKEVGAPETTCNRAAEILQAACERPSRDMVPLTLPNDDLFPIYALVGRAILMADRESAASHELEKWKDK